MSNTAPISGLVPDTTPAQAAQAPAPGPSTSPGISQPPQGAQGANLRLVIEDDKAAGTYVYITPDPATGKVVSQIPREQLLKMRESADYHPGSIVNSRT